MCVNVCVCVRERERDRERERKREREQNAFQEDSQAYRAGLFFPFFGSDEGKLGGLRERGREVKAVVIETWPNQTHYHFYQFALPKMPIR